VGALVVFDEFHLMDLSRAFLTGAAGLRLFRDLTQSVWMTATATAEPIDELRRTLDCSVLSLDPEDTRRLPVVVTTTRRIVRVDEPLTAETIKKHAAGRTIVIVNTVDRAQRLYLDLADWTDERHIPLRCLHDRFLKPDRDGRAAGLQSLFGRSASGPAILVATQVVEASVDVSCETLLTELCPMNALLQRAGRCARYDNESGVVHVFSHPMDPSGHLPYGEPSYPDAALAATDALLREREGWEMSPEIVEQWAERVHGERDANAIKQVGWRRRLDEVTACIRASVVGRDAEGVSDLIRQSDDGQVRVVVSAPENRPSAPSEREALAASRWSIGPYLRPEGEALAWYWDFAAEDPEWRELRSGDELSRAYVVCLSPAIARYTPEAGLRLGEAGIVESPERDPPKRPGRDAIRNESWAGHTNAVARRVVSQYQAEGAGSLAVLGFEKRFHLNATAVETAMQVSALLHDVGKLQQRWQRWATTYQRERDGSWVVREPLAHTDFDPNNPADRERSRRAGSRGPHALASAWYGAVVLKALLGRLPFDAKEPVAAACLTAVVAHHGGWIPDVGDPWDVAPPIDDWAAWIGQVTGVRPSRDTLGQLNAIRDKRARLALVLDVVTAGAALEEWFALVAYLTRALRIADQRATSERGEV
jgi:CRISPR-associated endonuclease/helicase Cas3